MNAKELVQYYDSLESEPERQNFKVLWQDIFDYVFPRKNSVTVKTQPGSRRTERLYDSTAIHSNDLLAASLQGSLTSNSVLWFNIMPVNVGDEEIDDDRKLALSATTKRMYQAFNNSNYRVEIHELFLDLTAPGTACMLIEENEIEIPGFNGLQFHTYHINDYVIEEGSNGFVDTVIMRRCLTPKQAVEKFGNKAGTKVIQAFKKGIKDKFDYLHVIMPIKVYGKKLANDDWKWTNIYVSKEDNEVVKEGGYHEFPCVVPRWAKGSGEKYGRSPSFNALPDIRTLNAAISYMLQAWAKDIKPSRLVPEGLGVNIDDVPGTNIPVPAHLIEPIIKGVLTSSARWEVSEQRVQDLRRAIKEIYYTDQIQIQKQAQMTATESQITFELMQRLLGPVFGRMEVEIFTPLVERVFGIMLRAGALPEIEDHFGDRLDIQYIGPLARSQRMSEVNAIQKWFEQMSIIAPIRPDVLDVPDFDEIVKDVGRLLGVSEKYINNSDIISDIRQQRQQQQQEAQAMEEVETGADALSKIGKLG